MSRNDDPKEGGCNRPGSYLLCISLEEPKVLCIGALGEHLFLPGDYIYCGSALNGVGARISRHFRKEKRMHWHIDYLLAAGEAVFAFVIYSDDRKECDLANALAGIEGVFLFIKGFGSSDCDCPGHLFYCGELTAERLGRIKAMIREW